MKRTNKEKERKKRTERKGGLVFKKLWTLGSTTKQIVVRGSCYKGVILYNMSRVFSESRL